MSTDPVEAQITEWRHYLTTAPSIDERDVEELESHLREQSAELRTAGLSGEEAVLIAVKRMGDVDTLSQEFAREHSGRLWKQLLLKSGDVDSPSGGWVEAFAFAAGAAVAVRAAMFAAGFPDDESGWLLRNLSLVVLPFLAGYFARRRGLGLRGWLLTTVPFALAAVIVNVFPYQEGSSTELLVGLHLPVALWFVVAYPYTGARIRSHERRMDFVRFTGEWAIYYALIALGGGVLMGLTGLILEPIGTELAEEVLEWVLPTGAAGAVVVAAWLVESKQRVVENMAPVLTMIFTPLFAVMLTVAAITYAVSGVAADFDRELLGVFDALLVVVLGLVLYSTSARDPSAAPGSMDRVQLLAVASALALDILVLGSMVARIGDLGLTPNRVAALGLNLVLLVDLGWTAWLSARFLSGRAGFHRIERWQISSLPALAVWAGAVVVVLPPLFGFA
jgi:hypothetical protein